MNARNAIVGIGILATVGFVGCGALIAMTPEIRNASEVVNVTPSTVGIATQEAPEQVTTTVVERTERDDVTNFACAIGIQFDEDVANGQMVVTNNSSKTSNYWIEYMVLINGTPFSNEYVIVNNVMPGEQRVVLGESYNYLPDGFDPASITCQLGSVERTSAVG